uniref:Uncharacterized protein n=1 Tax=Panagrolaimus sp. JU765 TaxID=591449 RepID=A0AC34RBK1_9BILA
MIVGASLIAVSALWICLDLKFHLFDVLEDKDDGFLQWFAGFDCPPTGWSEWSTCQVNQTNASRSRQRANCAKINDFKPCFCLQVEDVFEFNASDTKTIYDTVFFPIILYNFKQYVFS